MFNHKSFNVALLIAACGIGSTNVMADDHDGAKMRTIATTAGLISLEDASAKALVAKPGAITDAELDRRHVPEGWNYEFEIVDKDGKEWDVDVDAKTGEVRKVSQDWF